MDACACILRTDVLLHYCILSHLSYVLCPLPVRGSMIITDSVFLSSSFSFPCLSYRYHYFDDLSKPLLSSPLIIGHRTQRHRTQDRTSMLHPIPRSIRMLSLITSLSIYKSRTDRHSRLHKDRRGEDREASLVLAIAGYFVPPQERPQCGIIKAIP